MQSHLNINDKYPLNKEHFDRWISYFNLSVDELFEGPKASYAKERALSVATIMQIKIYQQNTEGDAKNLI